MATASGYGRSKSNRFSRNSSPDDSSPPPSSNRNSHKQTRRDSTDLDDMTLTVVDEFKDFVKSSIKDREEISQSMVESEVVNIRRKNNINQCNIKQWKKDLPRDIQNCSDRILRESMAYGNNPNEVKSIIQSKMNNTSPTDTSLDGIIDPLKTLKKDLERSEPPNLFRAIHKIDDSDIERADRLFYSEAHHFAPGLKDYTFIDAHNAVQAIRTTKYQSDDSKILIPMIKTCREFDEVRDYLEKDSKVSTKRDESPPSDDSRPPSHSIINSSTRNKNDTSTFNYKPMSDPYISQSSARTSTRLNNQSQDEAAPSSPRRPINRK
jgi:hypothetical protein